MKKNVLLFILLFFVSVFPVYAMPTTFNRNELENYGVNKNWDITEENLNHVLNTYAVDASEKIYDFSDVLTEDQEKTLKEKIDLFREKYHMELVILIDQYNYPSIIQNYCYNEDLADRNEFEVNDAYAADFYDYNDFGIDYDMSGILIFRNTAIDPCFGSMYYDMYTFGDAQLYFDQSRYDSILDSIYDDLHEENYLDGFSNFIDEVDYYISSGKPSAMNEYYIDDDGFLQKYPAVYQIPWTVSIVVSSVVTFIIMIILVSKNKMIHKAVDATQYLKNDSIHITNRKDTFVTSHVTSYTESDNDSGGGGGGFSSFGGSSGGGHSSGGGRHG